MNNWPKMTKAMSEMNNQLVDPLWPESLGFIAYGTGVGILNVYPQPTGLY
jgi:hypothetical protein